MRTVPPTRPVVLSSLLAAGLLAAAAPAPAADLFVTASGSGSSCTRVAPCSLATALSQASSGDAIYVAAGTFTGTGSSLVTIDKNLALYGGWDGGTSGAVTRDPASQVSVLDGEQARRVITIASWVTATVDGFTITRGNATGLTTNCPPTAGNAGGCGGGIYVGQATATISNNIIKASWGATSSTTTGYGGGVCVYYATNVIISGNVLRDNVASTAGWGSGGGLVLDHAGSSTRVEANEILSNTATTGPKTGWGGGIAIFGGSPTLQDNILEANTAASSGPAQGSGLYQWFGNPTIAANIFSGHAENEAVYLGHSEATFERNRVHANTSTNAVYLLYQSGSGAVLTNNVIGHAGTTAVYAQGFEGEPLSATLNHNTIAGNGATTGVYAGPYASLSLANTIVSGHATALAASATSGTLTADHTLFWDNTTDGIRGTNSSRAHQRSTPAPPRPTRPTSTVVPVRPAAPRT